MTEIVAWRSRLFETHDIRGVFCGRDGGISEDPFASLNLGADLGDAPEAVAENERRVLAHLGTDTLYLPHQVHGGDAEVISRPLRGVIRGRDADAVVTNQRGLAVGVLTADCVPLLLAATSGEAVGVAHAGWRGLLAGVIGRAILMMTRAYGVQPADLLATIGPAIGPKQYDVSRELGRQFLRDRADLLGVIWPDRRTKPHLDLRLMAMKDLLIAGVPGENIDLVGPTTDDPRCFSHRRDKGRTGRQLAAVMRAP